MQQKFKKKNTLSKEMKETLSSCQFFRVKSEEFKANINASLPIRLFYDLPT